MRSCPSSQPIRCNTNIQCLRYLTSTGDEGEERGGEKQHCRRGDGRHLLELPVRPRSDGDTPIAAPVNRQEANRTLSRPPLVVGAESRSLQSFQTETARERYWMLSFRLFRPKRPENAIGCCDVLGYHVIHGVSNHAGINSVNLLRASLIPWSISSTIQLFWP